VFLMLVLVADASVTRAQGADPARPLRVLMRVQEARDEALLARLRGQTSDLAVMLEPISALSAPGAWEAQPAAVFAQCSAQGADALLAADWSEAREPGAWITLATCSDRRLLTRQVKLDAGAGSSGLAEACALVLRGALSVLSQGGSIGVHVDSEPSETTHAARLPTAAPAATSSAAPRAAAPPAPTASAAALEPSLGPLPAAPAATPSAASVSHDAQPPKASARARFYGALAVQEAWDGASPRGQPALQVSLALGGRAHQLQLTGSIGLPVELRDAYTHIVLSRHGIAAGWRMNAWRKRAWRLRVGADLGTALYQRSVQATSQQAHPRDAALAFAPVLSGSAELQRELGPVWLALGAGVDGVLRIPQFVYQSEGGQHDALTLWPLVPRLFLALAWESP
jgi:hypothetical protein